MVGSTVDVEAGRKVGLTHKLARETRIPESTRTLKAIVALVGMQSILREGSGVPVRFRGKRSFSVLAF